MLRLSIGSAALLLATMPLASCSGDDDPSDPGNGDGNGNGDPADAAVTAMIDGEPFTAGVVTVSPFGDDIESSSGVVVVAGPRRRDERRARHRARLTSAPARGRRRQDRTSPALKRYSNPSSSMCFSIRATGRPITAK
mgnify:CR=1 FL=1